MRRLEGNKLNPVVDTDGVHWFHEEDVDALLSEIVKTGRSLPAGAANEALALARKEKQELVDDLEFAQMTVNALRRQVLVLQQRVNSAMYDKGAAPRADAGVLRGLHEDIGYLFRHIDSPSFQTELVVTRVQTALNTL